MTIRMIYVLPLFSALAIFGAQPGVRPIVISLHALWWILAITDMISDGIRARRFFNSQDVTADAVSYFARSSTESLLLMFSPIVAIISIAAPVLS